MGGKMLKSEKKNLSIDDLFGSSHQQTAGGMLGSLFVFLR